MAITRCCFEVIDHNSIIPIAFYFIERELVVIICASFGINFFLLARRLFCTRNLLRKVFLGKSSVLASVVTAKKKAASTRRDTGSDGAGMLRRG